MKRAVFKLTDHRLPKRLRRKIKYVFTWLDTVPGRSSVQVKESEAL
jgi:hypothetical protein